MTDSVFSPFFVSLFASEQPEMAIAQIEDNLNAIERRTQRALSRTIDDAVAELMSRAESLIDSQDVRGIRDLTWTLPSELRLPMMACWEQGFLAGSEDGISEMQASLPSGQFSVQDLVRKVLALTPITVRNTPAEQAILQRTNYLAGDFSDDILKRLKTDLIAAVIAPEGEQYPISRRELSNRIQKNLNVSAVRSEAIARTELTAAYNTGRVTTYDESDLVTHVRFIAIGDDRTTPICRSRNGMVFPKGVTGNTPPLHVRCRSVLSPLMPSVNKRHAEMVADPTRDPKNRELVALPKGWKTSGNNSPVRTKAEGKKATSEKV